MPSISIRASKLACGAAFAAFCLIGWVAKATLAQDPPVRPAPPQLLGGLPATAPAQAQDLSPNAEATKPSATRDHSPAPFQEQIPGSHATSEPLAAQPAAAVIESSVTSPPHIPNAEEDPEKAALAFVAQNQKQAEFQLKNLKDEEANLKARLRKVEAGIKRWESLLGALKQSQAIAPHRISGSVVVPPSTIKDDPDTVLDPVAPPPKPRIETD